MSSSSQVHSVFKAMQLLDCFAEAQRPLSLMELSTRTGWAKSTIHGLLAAMRDSCVIEQSEKDGKYRLGIRLFELGNLVSSSWDVVGLSRELMQDIAFKTGESVSLSTLSRGSILILDQVEPASSFRVVSEVGSHMPAHCTSQGKLLLSFLTPGERRRILTELGMQAYTPHTIITIEDMEKECAGIREAGYAVEDGEYHIGLRSVSAPIRDVSGTAVYSIGVIGMFRRITSEDFETAKHMVIEAAEAISYRLGARQ